MMHNGALITLAATSSTHFFLIFYCDVSIEICAVLFVKEKAKSFEEALDLALNALAEKIKRFKSKINQIKIGRLPEISTEF